MDEKRKLLAAIRKADQDFGLIKDGDKIMVGVSGGKDSLVLLYLLKTYQKFSDKNFSFAGVMLDLGFPINDLKPLKDFFEKEKIPFEVENSKEVYSILKQHTKNGLLPCSICSRMKKAAIIKAAKNRGYTKVSFAHHADDAIETLLMNMTHGGRLATFSPQMYLERSQIQFIRPLIYAREKDILSLTKKLNMPVIKSTCPNDQASQRASFKHILQDHYEKFPDAYDNFLTMLTNKEHADLWFDELGYNDGKHLCFKEATTPKEVFDAVGLRNKIFLVEQKIEPIEEFDGSDEKATSYVLYEDGRAVGTLRTTKIDDHTYSIGRLCIAEDARHKGYATFMLQRVEILLSQQVSPITFTLHAQTYARSLYEKLGYQQIGDEFVEAGVKHIPMRKVILHPIMGISKRK